LHAKTIQDAWKVLSGGVRGLVEIERRPQTPVIFGFHDKMKLKKER
jgi:hypothetical protein